jgi:hypothetical protein
MIDFQGGNKQTNLRIDARHGDQVVEWSGLVDDAWCRGAALCLRGATVRGQLRMKSRSGDIQQN